MDPYRCAVWSIELQVRRDERQDFKVKFEVEPGFMHTLKEPRYFVLRFAESDPEYAEGYRYEIQFLNTGGEGGATLMFREHVNSEGLSVAPF